MESSEIVEIVDEIKSQSSSNTFVLGVAGDVYIGGNKLFVLEKKDYWKKEDNKTRISYQNVGGAVEENETFLEALSRETKEELDAEISILDSKETIFISPQNKKQQIEIDDKKSPVMISSEIHKGKPGRPEAEGKWHLIGIMFKANLTTDFTPSSEISGTLEIDKKYLKNKMEFDYSHLIESNRARVLENESIPKDAVFYPKFSAKRQIEHLE